jgi:hypothetical protein
MTKIWKYAGIGSRRTPSEICAVMADVGMHLSKFKWILRSGAALGADSAFETGHRRFDVDGSRCEIFVPVEGYNGHASKRLPVANAFEIAQRFVNEFDRRSTFARAAHARNMMQILGADLDDPVDIVICWTSDGKSSGGTGSAIRCAEAHGTPVLNLGDPRQRIEMARILHRIRTLVQPNELAGEFNIWNASTSTETGGFALPDLGDLDDGGQVADKGEAS